MGSAKKSSAVRSARIEEMRRAEKARERRNRLLVIAAGVVAVAGLVVGSVVLVQSQSDGDGGGTAAESESSGTFVTGDDGVRKWEGELGRNHVTKAVDYPVSPPVGGDHNPVWMNCNGDVYTDEINDTNAVHSLEHGAVWVTYNASADEADVDALAAKVKKTPYTLMSPVDGQKDPIMLSAWGHQRTVTGADDPALDAFFEKFVQGEQTPEPGAACTNGLSE